MRLCVNFHRTSRQYLKYSVVRELRSSVMSFDSAVVVFFLSQRGSADFKRTQKMAGWMTCDFKSFLAVFQSYQDDVGMIMKGCVQWNSVYG